MPMRAFVDSDHSVLLRGSIVLRGLNFAHLSGGFCGMRQMPVSNLRVGGGLFRMTRFERLCRLPVVLRRRVVMLGGRCMLLTRLGFCVHDMSLD